MILGLSSASVAYCGSLLTQKEVKLGGTRTGVFLAAVSFFVLAVVASVLVAFTRLQDARETAKIVRSEGESMAAQYVAELRSEAERWGKITWVLLYTQLTLFSLGAICLLVALWMIFQSKLFPCPQ